MKIELASENIWVATQPVDFRKSINGLQLIILDHLGKKPHEGLYVFYNRHKDKLKLLGPHRNGFALLYKRLEKGRFRFNFPDEKTLVSVNASELSWLIAGLDWQAMSEWEELEFDEYA